MPGLDYGKFDKIVDSDEEREKEEKKKKVSKKAEGTSNRLSKCENCQKTDGKLLKCRCKKVAYCSLECQRKDYKFHKRVCKVPETKKPPPEDDSTKKKKKPASSTKKAAFPGREDSDSDSDAPLTWYKHRETKLPSSETSAPSKIAEPPKPTTTEKTVGSAWNAAGTWEERDVLKYVQEAVSKVLAETEVQMDSGTIRCSGTTCEGDASVGVVRGSLRRLLDLNIAVAFEAALRGTTYKGKLHVRDFTHQSDDDSVEVHLELADAAKLHNHRVATALKFALLGAPDRTSITLPPGIVGAAFAQLVVQRLRRDFLPDFLRLT